ncbi:hypothetical protein BGW41_003450 [Actinomortierella wolfii]|nr:hypothetical protein BGW41_003450 [Actinomortierella wolfii]
MTTETTSPEEESKVLCTKHSLHALDIQVIANHVAEYLSFQDIRRCALVSKRWNDNFEPILWRHPTSMPDWHERQKLMTEAVVERNAVYIESLRVAEATVHYKSLVKHTTRLKQLAVHFLDPHRKFPVIEKVRLIQQNKGLERLVLIHGWFNWANVTPLTHRHLKHLVLRKCRIERNFTAPFWELMTHIESIELNMTAVPCPNFKPSEWRFTNLRSITLARLPPLRRWHMRGPMLCDWIGRCPNLFKLSLQLTEAYTIPGKKLVQVIRQNNIPIKAFELSTWCRISEIDMGNLIGAVDGLEELKLKRWMSLGEVGSDLLLSQHANTLTRVNLRQARVTIEDFQSARIPSAYVQKILSSCPNLIEFHGLSIQASDMLSSPWVCSKLRVLRIFIQASNSQHHWCLDDQLRYYPGYTRIRQPGLDDGPKIKAHKGNNRYRRKRCNDEVIRKSILEHARIYDKISRLSNLEVLDFSFPCRVYYDDMTHLSMRFICGFGKLGRLRRLRYFGFVGISSQRGPTVNEMKWIVGWKSDHNKSQDPKQKAQQERQSFLINTGHRPWHRLEELRFGSFYEVHDRTKGRATRCNDWIRDIPEYCKMPKISNDVVHDDTEENVYPDDWDVIDVGPESEPPLTDTEASNNQ